MKHTRKTIFGSFCMASVMLLGLAIGLQKPVTKTDASVGNYTDVNASSFYSGISSTGSKLLADLHDLVCTKHRTYTAYDDNGSNLYQTYTDVDPNNSNHIIDFYSGVSIPKTWNPTAHAGYNREHLWCKSLSNNLWGETYGGGDIHHIRPTEVSANATRNNNPYGLVKNRDNYIRSTTLTSGGVTYTIDNFGYYNNGVFEPRDDKKGDVARIILYVYTHYSSASSLSATTNGTLPSNAYGTLNITDIISATSKKDAFKLLVDWNTSDPVDSLETHRNDVAAKYTGTRNPFIDHPEYVDYIWGTGSTKTLSSIEVSGDFKTEFYTGDNFSFGGTVTATYSDNSKSKISNASFSGYNMNQAGKQTVTVSYTENSITKTTSYAINVTQLAVSSIDVFNNPETSYYVGDYFDPTNLELLVTYNNGNVEYVTYSNNENKFSFEPSLTSALTNANNSVLITYEGKSCSVDISVAPVELSSIYIETAPTKINYNIGDYFDPSGMVVKACYNNGTENTITDYTWTPNGALTLDDTKITVKFGNKTPPPTIQVVDPDAIDIVYEVKYNDTFSPTLPASSNNSSTLINVTDLTANFSFSCYGVYKNTSAFLQGTNKSYLYNSAVNYNTHLVSIAITLDSGTSSNAKFAVNFSDSVMNKQFNSTNVVSVGSPYAYTFTNVYDYEYWNISAAHTGTANLKFKSIVFTYKSTACALSKLELINDISKVKYQEDLTNVDDVYANLIYANGTTIKVIPEITANTNSIGLVDATYSYSRGGKTINTASKIFVTLEDSYYLNNTYKTKSIGINDVVYLVSEDATIDTDSTQCSGVEMSGVSNNKGQSHALSTNGPSLIPLTVCEGYQDSSYAFKLPNGNYLSHASDANNITTYNSVNQKSSFSVSFDENGNAKIASLYDSRYIRFNGNESGKVFSFYKSTSTGTYYGIQLYKQFSETEINSFAVLYADYFVRTTRGENGPCLAVSDSEKLNGLQSVWSELSEQYSYLPSKAKTAFCTINSTADARNHYLFILGKFGTSTLDNYVVDENETHLEVTNKGFVSISGSKDSIVVIYVMLGSIAVNIFCIYRYKRRQHK